MQRSRDTSPDRGSSQYRALGGNEFGFFKAQKERGVGGKSSGGLEQNETVDQ